MPLALRFAARSHVGLVRTSNQDSGYAGPHLLVVADGMGGHAGGDIASSLAIGAMVHLDDDTVGSRALEGLEDAIADANLRIRQAAEADPALEGMGTTVTALLRTDRRLALAHIGDSRAYLLRGGTMQHLTTDHTFVQSLVDEGRITPDEAESHPQRHMVTRVLTGQPSDEPDLAWREIQHGDRYLLCSDGISGFVAQDTIAEVLADVDSPGLAADRLIDLALRSGGPDNATAIVAHAVRLGDGPDPNVAPQVVGAAAVRRPRGAVPEPRTPAEKAAALTRSATGQGAGDDDLQLAEEGPPSRLGKVGRWVGALAVLAVLLAGLGYAGWQWTQRQVYVGVDGANVAIYRGIHQTLGPVVLNSVLEPTDVPVADLPDFYRSKVDSTVTTRSLDDARSVVADLRTQADACKAAKAAGRTCGTPATAPTPTPTAPTTTNPTGGTA